MKWLNGYRMSLVLVGFVVVIVIGGGSAYADFTFGTPTNLGPKVNSSANEFDPCISADELEIFYHSERSGGYGNCDLWFAKRATKEEAWGEAVHLGSGFNTWNFDGTPCISADGLVVYFSSDGRSGGLGNCDIWKTSRLTRSEPWGPPVNLGPIINTSANESHPYISADGLSFYFADVVAPGSTPTRPGGYGGGDIWVSVRTTTNEEWGEPQNLGATINSSVYDAAPCLSADGLMLFFHSDRTGGYGNHDIWVARRKTPDDPWEEPLNLGPPVNTSVADAGPALSGDGKTLYFMSGRTGGSGAWDLWQVPIIPIVDLNRDGIIDSADMCIIVDHWGTDEPLCDIGPMPWGDGIVDVKDLIVLAEHLFEDLRIVAHWKFDETGGSIAYDSIDVNDGICHGEPLWQPAGGKVDGALQFDGIDDYVETPFVRSPADGSLSLFAWIKGAVPGQVIISQIDATRGEGSAWLCTDPSDGRLITRLMQPPFSPLESESVITDGLWHHVGFVYDFEGFLRYLYVDGAQVAKDVIPVVPIHSDGGLYIGADKTLEAATFFSGLIDDVRIYDAALTAEEIEALAQ